MPHGRLPHRKCGSEFFRLLPDVSQHVAVADARTGRAETTVGKRQCWTEVKRVTAGPYSGLERVYCWDGRMGSSAGYFTSALCKQPIMPTPIVCACGTSVTTYLIQTGQQWCLSQFRGGAIGVDMGAGDGSRWPGRLWATATL